MSELDIPESWCGTELGSVFTIVGGTTPKTDNEANFCDEGGVPWVTPADFSRLESLYISRGRRNISVEGAKSCSMRLLPKGSVLYSSRAPIGHCAIAENPIYTNQGFKSLVFNPLVDSLFALFYMRFITPKVEGMASGTTFKEVSGSVVNKVPFLLPPLGEQRRIVSKIESTFKRIEAIEKAVESAELLLTKYRESLLNKAFRGELVPQDPNDEPASKLLERIRAERAKQQDGKKKKKDELPPITVEEIPFEIPKSWEWVRLGEILEKLTDGTHHSPLNINNGPFKYISAKHIKNWGLDLSEITYVTKEVHEEIYARCDPKYGDVLLIKDGATTGVATINNLDEPFSMLSSVALLRPTFALNNSFLLFFLKSPGFQKVIMSGMAGAAIKRVTLSKLSNMILPLPPLKEQLSIYRTLQKYISRIDTTKTAIQKFDSSAARIKSAILNMAFSGRLVPQDSSEGTGHQLLEQILATKADASAKSAKAPTKQGRSK